MSPTSKKNWGAIGVITGIIAAMTAAFTVGINVSNDTHRYDMHEARIKSLETAVEGYRSDVIKIQSSLHEIKTEVAKQTVLLQALKERAAWSFNERESYVEDAF